MISSIAFALLLAAAGNSAHGASMWSIFANPLAFVAGVTAGVGIGGGDPSLTFTVNCSGAIVSCTPMPGYPRLIEAKCGHPGAGTLTVTDSRGVSQTLPVTVLPRSH